MQRDGSENTDQVDAGRFETAISSPDTRKDLDRTVTQMFVF